VAVTVNIHRLNQIVLLCSLAVLGLATPRTYFLLPHTYGRKATDVFALCFYRAMPCICGTSHGPVSVSVTSRCSIETAERIRLVFGTWASFHPSYTVLKGNSVISKNKGTSLWNSVLNSGLRIFRHGISIVETCYQLSSRKVDAQSVINWTVVGQLSPLYLRRSTTIVYRIDRQALSTARFCRTGQLATADTCTGLLVQVVSALLCGN